jgi:hypothetical protein
MARPPELEKSGAREKRDRGETRRSRASSIPPSVGFSRKTRQTRRSAAGRGFLRCDCGLRHQQSAEPVREGLSKAGNEFRHRDTRSIPALRVQFRYCALARFR